MKQIMEIAAQNNFGKLREIVKNQTALTKIRENIWEKNSRSDGQSRIQASRLAEYAFPKLKLLLEPGF